MTEIPEPRGGMKHDWQHWSLVYQRQNKELRADNARLRALVKDLADDELDMDHRARVVALAAKEPKP